MSLGDPDKVLITSYILSAEAHHGFKKGVLNVHVCTGVDSCDLLEIFPGVHMCKAAVFELFNFADDLSYKWIFEDYVAEALVMDSLEHGVVIGSLEAEYIEKVHPEIFQLG